MIRLTTPTDIPAILDLAIVAGLATPGETAELEAVLTDCLAGKLGPDQTWLTEDDSGPVGVAYFAPERMTDGTWNLYMIAIAPDRQGQGHGGKLLRHIEMHLASLGVRILIVDTSSLPEFERTRNFYIKNGYTEEARIREFWKAGDDKIIYLKALGVNS